MDRGNRAFTAFLGLCLVAFVGIGVAACVLLCIVAYRVQRDGFATLTEDGNDVRPAVVFLAVIAAGTLAGLWSLRNQRRAARQLDARIEALRLTPPSRLIEAAKRVGMTHRVDLVHADESFSFTYGLAKPRVVLSRELFDSLTDEELDAVLEHELYHVRNFDPLKLLVARILAPTLFFVPVLRELRGRYVAGRELAADRRALRKTGHRPLAGAMYKVVGSPAWVQLTPAAAIGGGEALDARVTQLETGVGPPAPPLSRFTVLLSALGATALAGGFLVSLFAFGGPEALARLCGG
jgi:beta-lactamase regulating signal transducer with metallopeptidase domain